MLGRIHYGINNIFTVKGEDSHLYECRLKGKILNDVDDEYNPLSVGDFVDFTPNKDENDKGMITLRKPRQNVYKRWNRKQGKPQSIAANIDLLVVVASPKNPPFRPRFIDRVLVAAGDNIPVLVFMNKEDQGIPDTAYERLDVYELLGVDYLVGSAKQHFNLEELKETIKNKTTAFVGQSGVGKSSLLNALFPDLNLRVGEISNKYNRGRHTTNYSILIEMDEYTIIDTPGIRELEVADVSSQELDFSFKEFFPYLEHCSFQPCSHIHEPSCAVKQAVLEEKIHEDRYDSYVRLYEALSDREGSQ